MPLSSYDSDHRPFTGARIETPCMEGCRVADLNIVREITGKQRDRIYIYDQYASILDEGTQPLP